MGLVLISSVLCVTKLGEMAGSELGEVYVGYQRKFFHPEHGGTGFLGQWLWHQTWQSSRAQISNGIPGMSCALSGAGLNVLEGSLLTQDIL